MSNLQLLPFNHPGSKSLVLHGEYTSVSILVSHGSAVQQWDQAVCVCVCVLGGRGGGSGGCCEPRVVPACRLVDFYTMGKPLNMSNLGVKISVLKVGSMH